MSLYLLFLTLTEFALQVKQKDKQLKKKDDQLKLKDDQLKQKDSQLQQKDEQLQQKDDKFNAIIKGKDRKIKTLKRRLLNTGAESDKKPPIQKSPHCKEENWQRSDE